MPEGKPLIPDDLVALLERNGITEEEARADFSAGVDLVDGVERYRRGLLATYKYRTVNVFGQVDYIVTAILLK